MRRSFWSVAALAVASAGCSEAATGELIVAIQTDMAVPKDLDHIELHVESGGKPVISSALHPLGRGAVELPATQGLLVSEDPSREISIRVRAIRRDRARDRDLIRVEHTVLTTVPARRVATLWVPLQFLCSVGEAGGSGFASPCPDDTTCVAGECRDRHVSSALLPDYVEEDVLRRDCFDVASCFWSAVRTEDLEEDCTIAASDDVNVAIATEGEGACGASGCFVPLDAESDFGWRRRGDRIELPKALCSPERRARLDVVTADVTPECPAKRIGDPLCRVNESQPVFLAARQRSPSSLAVGEDSVFWTEQGSLSEPDGVPGDGAVKRVALQGGVPETLASEQAAPRHLALDRASRQVFWTNRGIGAATTALMRRSFDRDDHAVPLLEQRELGASGALEGLATDGEFLFWTLVSGSDAPGHVGRAKRDGEARETVAEVHDARRIAAANGVVCWTELGQGDRGVDGVDDNGSVSCRKDGMTVTVATGQRTPYGIALDEKSPTEVFWVNFGGEVVRGRVDRESPEVIFKDHDQQGPYGIALDERSVYWTNFMQGTVNRLPRDAPPTSDCRDGACALATGQRRPGAIAVDTKAIYWVNEGSPDRADGAVLRLAKLPSR
ncbi:hypothetical protein ACMHYB_08930 [Sorangium sp. So ce1128]